MDEKKFADKMNKKGEEQSVSKIDMIRKFLEKSRAQFGVDRKTPRRDTKSDRQSKSKSKESKTPPRRPQAKKGEEKENEKEKESKMSFGRSGSFNKRSRLLRTEDEEIEKGEIGIWGADVGMFYLVVEIGIFIISIYRC